MTLETAREIAQAVARGETTAVEMVERALEQLERWQPVTNAFSQVFADEAIEQAKRSPTGTLGGVPVVMKDLFDMARHETTGCCAAYRGNVAARDADVVARIREAGAVVIAKANQHELAFGSTNLISDCGPAHNPFDPERITGGSSGGSAAAVAAQVAPISFGTDTGGSIRIPSSFCGTFGLKPTHGRLSLDGVMPLASSLDCPGPIARTASDLALVWEVLSGDASGSPAKRVAVLDTDRCTDQVLHSIEETVQALEGLGATTMRVADAIADAPLVWVDVAVLEFHRDHRALLEKRDLVHPIIGAFLDIGATQPPERLAEAREEVKRFRAWFDEHLSDADAILMPATPYAAPLATDEDVEVPSGDRIDVHVGGPSTFTRVVNLVGLPSVAIPAGRTPEGLPIGVQLVGRDGEESLLLATADALEQADTRFGAGDPPALPST